DGRRHLRHVSTGVTWFGAALARLRRQMAMPERAVPTCFAGEEARGGGVNYGARRDAVGGTALFQACRHLLDRGRLSFGRHVFSLCYEKTAGIQAAKNLRRKKALASVLGFCKSGNCKVTRSYRASVFRRPASWRVFFLLRHRNSFE